MMSEGSDGKASPGSPFRAPPAVIWNNMIDAGRAFADSRFSSGPRERTGPRPTDSLRLRNSSGADRAQGEILKIEGTVLTDQDAEGIWLDGVAITTDCRFGILLEPSVDGEISEAQVSGVCLALVNIIDTDHTFASAESGDYVLQSGDSGPIEILYAPASTGEQTCVVRFGSAGGCDPANAVHYWALSGLPTGGTFTVKYTTSLGTSTSSGIARNASAATIQTALEALSCIGSGNVAVSGGPINGTTVIVAFQGALANEDISPPIFDWTSITGGAGIAIFGWFGRVGR